MVVLCDSYYLPIKEIPIQHAVNLLVAGKAEAVQSAEGLKTVAQLGLAASAIKNWGSKLAHLIEGTKFMVPAVIRLVRAVAYRAKYLRPTRNAIFRRDRYTCQYCGDKNKISLDHVLPISRGGKDTWENLVTACFPCNNKKGNRTPDEASMALAKQPQRWTPVFTSELFNKIMGIE